MIVDRCESTNDLARQLGETGCEHGTWVSARVQERGRGRLGRKWESVEGNLFLSIVVRPEKRRLWTWIPMAAALGVSMALRDRFPGFPVSVKWPNDLWVKGRKLGGILCEAANGAHGAFTVIGIGLNCAAAPEGLDQLTTSVSAEIEKKIVADDVRAAVIGHVLEWMDLDPGRMLQAYEGLAALPSGTLIEWGAGAENGKVVGLGPFGELRVEQRGEIIPLYAEDVKIRIKASR